MLGGQVPGLGFDDGVIFDVFGDEGMCMSWFVGQSVTFEGAKEE